MNEKFKSSMKSSSSSSSRRGGLVALGVVVALTAYYVFAKRNHLPPTGTSVRMQSNTDNPAPDNPRHHHVTSPPSPPPLGDDATLANPWNNK